MIVVSNTSPINNLAAVNQLDLLQQLYSRIIIPEAVYLELTNVSFSIAGATEVQTLNWIEVRKVENRTTVEALCLEVDCGEAEAIALAIELNAEQLLIDERIERNVASRLRIRYVGILGILIEAKNNKLVPAVKPVLDNLIVQAGFWVANPLYERVLQIAGE